MGKKKDKQQAAQAGHDNTRVDPAILKEVDADAVGFLVAPEPSERFFSECWEKKPRMFKATPSRAALARSLTTLPSLLSWLKEREAEADGESPLVFGEDVNAARYRDGVRETPNGPGAAGSEDLQRLHDKEECTLQVHQPQRWDDNAWRLLSALEAQLGSLVGSNAYLTPAGTQGLAPHHDDVELWVVQTAGTKRWRCYAPLAGHELPSASSGDLPQAVLGAPVLEEVLAPGDVLYMPRGTVHQAVADGGAPSAHLTVSTCQRTSYGDLALHLLSSSLAAQSDDPDRCLPLAARRGPPPGLAAAHSLHRVLSAPAGRGPTPEAVQGLAAALRETADKLAAHPDMLTPAVHSFTSDFWAHRLPPHPQQMAPQGPAPEMGDRIWCRASRWCCLMPHAGPAQDVDSDEEGEEEEEGKEGKAAAAGGGGVKEEGAVKLVTCLHNVRETHMIRGGEGDGDSDDADIDSDVLMGSDGGAGEEEEGEGMEGGGEEGEGKERKEASKKGKGKKKEEQEDGGDGEEDGSGSGDGEEHENGHASCGADCGHDHHHGGAGDDDDSDDDSDDGDDEPGSGPESLPGMVFPGGPYLKALVSIMAADEPGKAVPIRDLPLEHDSEKLHLAFALWAEGFTATAKAGAGGSGKAKAKAKGKGKEGAGAPPAKKAKKGL